jgi:hypothetical protein
MVVVIGTLTGAVAAQTRGAGMDQRSGVLPSGLGESIDRDVARVRAATATFTSTEAAGAAGYELDGGCVEHQPDGAMGYHFKNGALVDTKLDLDHPEVLVYEKKPDGTFKLNGVEFLVSIADWKSDDPPRIMGQPLKKANGLGIWYLHVWTWTRSSSGLFADWNPDVKCAAAASMSHK